MSSVWKPHVTVATVVCRDDRFLMVEERCRGEQVFNQPAGHLDDGENLLAAAVRETQEETAWSVRLDYLLGIYLWRHPDNGSTFLRVNFAATPLQHDPEQALDEGILRATWLSRNELLGMEPRLRSPMVLRSIDDYLAGTRYPMDILTSWLPEGVAQRLVHQR